MASRHVMARNADTGVLLADHVIVASRHLERAIGLLSRSRLDQGEGLLIMPCRGVHTWGMRFAIDVIALDRTGRVVDAVAGMKPWRMRLPKRGEHSVLELPEGTLTRSATLRGHYIALEPAYVAAA